MGSMRSSSNVTTLRKLGKLLSGEKIGITEVLEIRWGNLIYEIIAKVLKEKEILSFKIKDASAKISLDITSEDALQESQVDWINILEISELSKKKI